MTRPVSAVPLERLAAQAGLPFGVAMRAVREGRLPAQRIGGKWYASEAIAPTLRELVAEYRRGTLTLRIGTPGASRPISSSSLGGPAMVITKRGAPAPALSPEESALLAGAPPGSVATGIRPGAVHGGTTNQTGPARGAPVPFLSEAETAIFASMPTEVHEYVAGLPTDRQRCQARRIIVDLHNEAAARARAEFIAALPPRRVDVQEGIFRRVMAGLRKAFAAPETGEQAASSPLPTDPAADAELDKQAKAIVARLPRD